VALKTNIHHNNGHQPVLLEAILQLVKPQPDESYLDLTAGYGGHASAIIERTHAPDKAVLVDRDADAHEALKKRLPSATIVKRDFLAAAKELSGQESVKFDVILMDLGVSSPHFDTAERGFSLKRDGPLDMRMDRSQELTAGDIVNDWPEFQLAEVIARYGQEPQGRRIAKAIVHARPLESTLQLAEVIEQAVNRPRAAIHPATKTFQALRIAVNDELEQLADTLPLLPDLLAPGGRVAIISFHSLEDRLVKQFLKSESRSGYEARLKLLVKKPIRGDQEDVHNPRARSAKLRAAEKIKTERDTHAN
jgi:16S rRNA (cytosine1402-N4)-methyltransferase